MRWSWIRRPGAYNKTPVRVEAGDLWTIQAKPGHASAAVDGADVAQAEEVPY